MVEKNLQDFLIKDIQNHSLFKKIIRQQQIIAKTHPGDFFNRLMEHRYNNNVRIILESLEGDIEIINNEEGSIKSISLGDSTLYPDILAKSIQTNDYLIFELKIDANTER